jgi:cytochrome P450
MLIISISDDTWVHHRKFLEASFQLDVIKSFISIFVDSSNQMLTSLHDQMNVEQKKEQEIDIFKLTSRCALTMVLATSFGTSASEVHFDDEILKAVEE